MVFGDVAFGKWLRWGPHECGGGGGLVAKLCLTPATPWTVACQASLSMGFSRQEYWSGLQVACPAPHLEGGETQPPASPPRTRPPSIKAVQSFQD